MALKTDSMPPEVKEEKPTGEVRLDKEGKGYWFRFDKIEPKQEEIEVTISKPKKKKSKKSEVKENE